MEENIIIEINKQVKGKGGRPRKNKSQVRMYKHSFFLDEAEEKLLNEMMQTSKKEISQLIRLGLFGKNLLLPKAQLIPTELFSLLSDIKRMSSLLQLLAHRERDFTSPEKDILLGSSSSLRFSIERVQRHIFASLEKSDEFVLLSELIAELKLIREEINNNSKPLLSDYHKLDNTIEKLEYWFEKHYRYLTLST